jgi:hypothetical protein
MIDHSIYEVFHRDKKVVIPDFGAIIFSEVTDTIDFSDLLTFDDGKVIAEIQKQQNLPEEEARYALSEYVQRITNTLNQGMLHFFEGIGYLAKDPQGSFFIHKTKPSPDEIGEENVPESEETGIDTHQEEIDANSNISEDSHDNKDNLDQSDVESAKNEDYPPTTSKEEQNAPTDDEYSYKRLWSEEDENVQEYYKRKDNLYGHNKKRSPYITAMLVALPIILMGLAALYYFNYYIPQNVQDNDVLQQSQLSHSSSLGVPADNYAEKGQTKDEEKNENESGSSDTNADDSQSSQQNPAADSPSSIDRPTSSEAKIGQNKNYSLIIGSFKEEHNADKLQQRFQKQGMEVSKFQRDNNFYFVGIEHIDGKYNAVKLLTKIREEEPNAWIINNN